MDRADGRHQRDRHRPGRAARRSSCSPPSTSSSSSTPGTAPRRPSTTPAPASCSAWSTSAARRSPCTPRSARWSRPRSGSRRPALAAPRAAARAAAQLRRARPRRGRAVRCCSSTTTAGWRTTPGSRSATGSPCPAPSTARSPCPASASACPSGSADGWLVRPAGGPRPITARLDLTSGPVLEVRAVGESWRAPLSRRHAEILAAAGPAGPAGLTAARPEPHAVRRRRPRRHRARGGLPAAPGRRGAGRDRPLPPGRRRRAHGGAAPGALGPSAPLSVAAT